MRWTDRSFRGASLWHGRPLEQAAAGGHLESKAKGSLSLWGRAKSKVNAKLNRMLNEPELQVLLKCIKQARKID